MSVAVDSVPGTIQKFHMLCTYTRLYNVIIITTLFGNTYVRTVLATDSTKLDWSRFILYGIFLYTCQYSAVPFYTHFFLFNLTLAVIFSAKEYAKFFFQLP